MDSLVRATSHAKVDTVWTANVHNLHIWGSLCTETTQSALRTRPSPAVNLDAAMKIFVSTRTTSAPILNKWRTEVAASQMNSACLRIARAADVSPELSTLTSTKPRLL